MESIRSILPAMLEKAGLKKRLSVESIILHWPEIAGAEISANAKPAGFQRGVLMVAVKSPVWSHHLFTMRESIIRRINEYIGGNLVQDIKFYAGNFQNEPNNENIKENLPISRLIKDIQLNEQDVKNVRQAVVQIKDENLRDKVYKVLIKDMAFRRWKIKNGWRKCKKCGALCPPEQHYCTLCGLEKKQATVKAIKQVLKDAPWLSFDECSRYIECSRDEYDQARTGLIGALRESLGQENHDPLVVASLAMLMSGIKPDAINESVLKNTLDSIRRKKHVSSFRS